MSQVTEQSVRFQTALASIKLIQASAVLDLTEEDRKSGSAGMPRPISYAVFCLKKKKNMATKPDVPPALLPMSFSFFFFNDTATTEIYTLSLHDALPICGLLSESDAVQPLIGKKS